MSVTVDFRVLELLCGRLCHELISPVGAINNGVELLDEDDPEFVKEAMTLIAQSARRAGQRLQFYRFAYGTAGGSGSAVDARELVQGLLEGGKVKLEWNVPQAYWPKDWAKLLMNATLLGSDCLPRGGLVKVDAESGAPRFRIHASGTVARIAEEVERMLKGAEPSAPLDARGIQPYLTHRLARSVHGALQVKTGEGFVEITAA